MDHIGRKIKEIVQKRGISKSELGRRIGTTSTNVFKIFQRKSIGTELLMKLSRALDHDFFQHFKPLK